MPLLVSAPTRPLVCVPCHELSSACGVASGERPGSLLDFGQRQPVARIRRVGVAPVAVIGDRHVADQVVAGQQIAAGRRALEIGVVEPHAGVDHGDDDAGAAGAPVPCRFDIDRRLHGARRGAQIPLSDGGPAGSSDNGWTCEVQGIVRHGGVVAATVGHGILDVALGGEALRQIFRRDSAAEHHLRALGHAGARAQRDTQTLAERCGAVGLLLDRRCQVLAQQRRIGLVLDDHARTGVSGRRLRLDVRGLRQQHRAANGQREQWLAHDRALGVIH